LVKKRLPPSKAVSKETVTYNRRVGKWEVQQRKAGEKMEQAEVPNVKKDDTGRQDPLTVGKSHKIRGTMSPSQGRFLLVGFLLVVQDIGWVEIAARPYKAQMSGPRIIGAWTTQRSFLSLLPPAARP
jgi:hypothetical protein